MLSPDELPDGIHFFWPSSYTITDARAPIMLCSHIFLAAAAAAVPPAPFCEMIPGVAVAFVAATAAHSIFFLFLHFIFFFWLTTRYDVDAAAAGSATPRTDGSATAADVVVVDDDVVASTHTHIRAGCTQTHTIHFPYTFIYARLLIPAATKIRRFLRFLPKIFFFPYFRNLSIYVSC